MLKHPAVPPVSQCGRAPLGSDHCSARRRVKACGLLRGRVRLLAHSVGLLIIPPLTYKAVDEVPFLKNIDMLGIIWHSNWLVKGLFNF